MEGPRSSTVGARSLNIPLAASGGRPCYRERPRFRDEKRPRAGRPTGAPCAPGVNALPMTRRAQNVAWTAWSLLGQPRTLESSQGRQQAFRLLQVRRVQALLKRGEDRLQKPPRALSSFSVRP